LFVEAVATELTCPSGSGVRLQFTLLLLAQGAAIEMSIASILKSSKMLLGAPYMENSTKSQIYGCITSVACGNGIRESCSQELTTESSPFRVGRRSA